MKTLLKRMLHGSIAAGLLVLGLGLAQKVHAASTDTITLSVTPSGVSYAVQITSPTDGSSYSFGSIALGATTGSTAAIGVKNVGTISEYFVMKVGNTNPDNWAPVGGNPSTDQFRLRGRGSGRVQPDRTEQIQPGFFEDWRQRYFVSLAAAEDAIRPECRYGWSADDDALHRWTRELSHAKARDAHMRS